MTPEQFEREKDYRVSLTIAKSMLKKGIINEQDYEKVKGLMLEEYRPVLGIVDC